MKHTRVMIAPNAFKHSLNAAEVAPLLFRKACSRASLTVFVCASSVWFTEQAAPYSFCQWSQQDLVQQIHDKLVTKVRLQASREPSANVGERGGALLLFTALGQRFTRLKTILADQDFDRSISWSKSKPLIT